MKSVILLLVFTALLVRSVFCQTTPENLVRSNAVLNKNKTSVYLCVDLQQSDSDFVWFQLHNNTIWGLSFHTDELGEKLKSYKLADNRNVIALENKAISAPHYQIESIVELDASAMPLIDGETRKAKQSAIIKPLIKWRHLSTVSWLLSGNYTLFKVPKGYFPLRQSLNIQYKYQWEIIGTVGSESNAPSHKVYTVFDPKDSETNSCVS